MRYVLLALGLAGVLAVACGGGGGSDEPSNPALPTAAVRINPASPTPENAQTTDTCDLSKEMRVLLEGFSKQLVFWFDYGFNDGEGRGDGVAIVIALPDDGGELEIPACAYQAAKRALGSED